MAEDQDSSQKTEEPTAKKLADARKRGEVAQSREVNHSIILIAACFFMALMLPYMALQLSHPLKLFITDAHHLQFGRDLRESFTLLLLSLLKIIALPIGVFVIAALLSGFIQNGILFAPERLMPKLSKISPIEGFKRMFSMRSIVEFAKGILKLALVAGIAALAVLPVIGSIEHFVGLPMAQLLAELHHLALRMMIGVTAFMVVVAFLDWMYQRFEFLKKMRMSRQDIKDEFKQTEGDPLIKQRLAQLRREKARQRMMADVPKADVVLTNPTHYAVALKYAPEEDFAPKLLAKGVDLVAQRIRNLAEEHNIPIVENPPLTRTLYATVEIGEEIQPEQYQAVAEIISYIFRLKGKTMPKN